MFCAATLPRSCFIQSFAGSDVFQQQFSLSEQFDALFIAELLKLLRLGLTFISTECVPVWLYCFFHNWSGALLPALVTADELTTLIQTKTLVHFHLKVAFM
jgi:hypothetical protein